MTKIYWLPISYQITYRQKRHQSTNGWSIREDVPLAIAEVSPDDAPVVMTLFPPPKVQRSKEHQRVHGYQPEGPYAPTHPHEIRSFGGKLMRPMMLEDGTPATEESLAAYDERNKGLERRDSERFPDYPFQGSHRCDRREHAMAEIYEYHHDDRDQKFAEAQVIVSSMVSIDGVLYKPAIEPVIQLCADGGPLADGTTATGPVVRVLVSGISVAEKDAVLFRADEMDLALQIAEDIANKRSKKLHVEGHLETDHPELLKFSPESEAITRLYAELKRFAAFGFGWSSFDTGNIRTWCDAMDKLQASQKGEVDFDEVGPLIVRFAETFPGGKDADIARLLAHTARNAEMPTRMEEDLAGIMLP